MRWFAVWLVSAALPRPLAPDAVRVCHLPEGASLLVVCKQGGVAPNESHIASGSICYLVDRSGTTASAGAVSVYDDSMAVP